MWKIHNVSWLDWWLKGFFLLWLLITLSTYVNYTRCIVVGLMIEQQKILSIVTNNFYITHVKVDKVDRTDDWSETFFIMITNNFKIICEQYTVYCSWTDDRTTKKSFLLLLITFITHVSRWKKWIGLMIGG